MEYIVICIAAVFAYFVKGITGFGNTLILASLVSIWLPNSVLTPIELLFSLPVNLYLVWKGRSSLNPRMIITLSSLLVIGMIPGVFILKTGDEHLLKVILGAVVIGLGIDMLLRRRNKTAAEKPNPVVMGVLGIGSGILTGMYGIGMPLTAYVGRSTYAKDDFRANICAVFVVDNVIRTVLYIYNGMFTAPVFKYGMVMLPCIIAGLAAAHFADKKLSVRAVRLAIIAVVLFGGALLLIQNGTELIKNAF